MFCLDNTIRNTEMFNKIQFICRQETPDNELDILGKAQNETNFPSHIDQLNKLQEE